MKMMHKGNSWLFMIVIVMVAAVCCPAAAGKNSSLRYFKIQVVDDSTGRGVPLVELRTVNNIRYYTDSNGIVAFDEPGLMDTEVFFFVDSHGYELPKDGFGYRGTRLKTTVGGSATIKIHRLNIAERLYRVTGQGIYRDSILTGHDVPLKHPVINGLVLGQDSVFACIYHDRLFWMWGDTSRPSYPLGNFGMSGAVSDMPGLGGLDPSLGVDLEYYVGPDGFSRKMCPLKEPGLVWLDGLVTVQDPQGNERMVAKFARLKGLAETLERGLMVFDDATETFRPIVRGSLDLLPYTNTGHAFRVDVEGLPYYYFTSPSPMSVRLRVRAGWEDVTDPNCYEILTALARPSSADWIRFDELLASKSWTKAAAIESLEREAKGVRVYDIESGKEVLPHNGTVYYNGYRRRWIGIFVQQFGESSNLGEVWYAEADTPVGPWCYARKIVTHNKYSFYNPKQHPFFDKDSGRVIFFEGTYSHTFSGSPETATPYYDYNQIMYRLNLDDSRLVMPSPVYEIHGEDGRRRYLLREDIEKENKWEIVESVPFCAIEPGRISNDLVPIYAKEGRLTLERPDDSAKPCFYTLPSDSTDDNSCVVSLYEYHNTDSDQDRYNSDPSLREQGWIRAGMPLCKVWKSPPAPQLIDRKAKPASS